MRRSKSFPLSNPEPDPRSSAPIRGTAFSIFPISRFSPCLRVSVVGLVLLALLLLPACAQTATPQLSADASHSSGWVVIPVDEYQSLRARAFPTEREPEPPPVDATLTRVDYDLHIAGELATGRASLTVDVLKDGWVRVPIPSGLLVREARLDGKLVSLVSGTPGKGGNQPAAVLAHAGRAVLLLDIALPVNAVISNVEFPRHRADQLAVTFQTATQPADVYQIDLRGMRVVRWTRSELGGLDPSTFVDAQLVRYAAGAGGPETMPAFLYKPRGATGKLPVVIIWHGGPESQSRPTFSSFVQLLASELRLAVLLPNVRGSAGYGKAYLAADDGVKREQALQDITATLDFIARQPDLDASRVGVYGGSYGGYMTLATAAFQGRRVRAAVDVVGISNLVTFLQNTQAYRRDLRRAEYGDERDPAVRAVQERISPLLSVDKIEAELFVQQGFNDPRVPRSEAEQIVKAVRGRGKDVWYLLGLNEGHGFAKKENRDYAIAAIALFLQQKLLEPMKTTN